MTAVLVSVRAALILLAGILCLFLRIPPGNEVLFLDVGQGECALLRCGGRNFLIDCGSSSIDGIWEKRADSCLKYYGIRTIDAVFLSHGDSDHINGLTALLENYQQNLLGDNAADVSLGCILCSAAGAQTDEGLKQVRSIAKKAGIEMIGMESGGRIAQEGFTITCLYPSREEAKAPDTDANQNSMVLLAQVGETNILFTGDLEKEGEERFLAGCAADPPLKKPGSKTILKAGHHGSRSATGEKLLDMLQPDAAVISCDKNNPYGHPAREVLDRLSKRRIPIWRTDIHHACRFRLP